ncbi:MAG: GtrA-like protein family [Rhodocyclales bacterium]|nr:GtrA-like protein family [Rhodocyclales bacterium]
METGSLPLAEASSLRVDARAALLQAFIKYVAVGGIAFVVDWGTLNLCLWLGLHYMLGTALGFVFGLLTNYSLCVAWVWPGTRARSVRDVIVFSLIGLGGLALTELGMWLSVGLMHFHPSPSKIVLAAIVLVWNFSLRRIFVFFH